jgi:hypothetical protein
MLNSLSVFEENIKRAREIGPLYDYLVGKMPPAMDFDDLLRSQVVYSVSAFDKLIHDVVRIGMIGIFTGIRAKTPKYLSESIPLATYNEMLAATIPPKEFIFTQFVVNKLKTISYQDPKNVADGLSYIWIEDHKWQRIALAMGLDEHSVKTKLRLIIDRRNYIVHEADIDPSTGLKRPIVKADSESTISFLEDCGKKIVRLVV